MFINSRGGHTQYHSDLSLKPSDSPCSSSVVQKYKIIFLYPTSL